MMRFFVHSYAFLLIVAAAGCGGGSGPEFQEAGGVVTLQGEPLANASVTFIPVKEDGATAGPVATAVANQAGEFQLSTGGESGAVAGTHKVTVTLYADSGSAAPAASLDSAQSGEERMKMMNEMMQRTMPDRSGKVKMEEPKSLVPPKYTTLKTTPLEYEIKPGAENRFKIELTN